MKTTIFLAISAVLLISACVSQQEIKLGIPCESEDVHAQCEAACTGNYSAELDAWRCSATGYPVCICKAYKDSGQFIG